MNFTRNGKRRNAAVITALALFMLLSAAFLAFGSGKQDGAMEGKIAMKSSDAMPGSVPTSAGPMDDSGVAVLAGGCFWGIEGVFEKLKGVTDVVSGYSGGEAETAHYGMVGTGTTGHAESVRIVFDPKQISFKTLLEVFFLVAHNPTELNYQGPDHGTQYRSAVFYQNEAQKQITEDYIAELGKEHIYKKPIVTQVVPFKAFYPAEDYHQDFMRLHPNYPYIVYWDAPKVKELEREFPDLIAKM